MTTWEYPVRHGADGRPIVVELHDGNSCRLLLDAGCDAGVFPWLRIAGVRCPDLGAPGGVEAAAFTAVQLAEATRVDVKVHGRSSDGWVADIVVDGQSLAERLVKAGYGDRTDTRADRD